ncbi:MAG TPA: beta-L-arabinofuranosidase domain-containing protein [Telluria sp.]|nr:beta-L-arabinofuranosidase domain-containing protein [Telluria sp.]
MTPGAFPPPSAVRLGGLLGAALDANLAGRLTHFVTDETSPAIALFGAAHKCCNHEGDWYGEHAGKWLSAAARAASRSGDAMLTASVLRVADFLVAQQEADGYLGTYAPARRFMVPQAPPQRTWDGAPSQRTWDIWTHSYLILGLLEVHRHFPAQRYLDAACRIGDLCLRALTDGGIDITHLGNHHGMSATVLLDPAAELYLVTGQPQFLQLATLILAQANARAELELLPRALAGRDACEIATGKAYQLCWNLVGLAKLYRATGQPDLLDAVRKLWDCIREHHLSLGGGPWGGVAHRSREVFNWQGWFDPRGYIETCSTFSWIQLNRELLAITGDARYAEEIERAAYNDLLAAQAPNGEDWCYYIYPNGKRVFTTYWRCCKSSGALALEELPSIAYAARGEEIAVNLYGPGTAAVDGVTLRQETDYPFDGAIRLHVDSGGRKRPLALRIPSWAGAAQADIDGVPVPLLRDADGYARVVRAWDASETLTLRLPLEPVLHRRVNQNTQESLAPDGSPVAQQVMCYEYAAITRGPLVYATELIDGFKTDETIRLPAAPRLQAGPPQPGYAGPSIRLELDCRGPLLFQPYYEAGGRHDGGWRLTWLQLAPP